MDLLGALVVGILTGLHAATWGAYKDTTYEGWRPASFVRSILLGGIASILFGWWQAGSGNGSTSLLVWVGVAYTLERMATEWWKAFLRTDDQSAYTIPMRIAVGGSPIDDRPTRWVVGAGVVAVIGAAGLAITMLQDAFSTVPTLLAVVLVGGLGGWATAIGGAWKDAPIEGFSARRFVRSPVVATSWAIPTSLLTGDWLLVMLSAGGLSVASIETYKSFFTGRRPPGKFGSKSRRWDLPVLERCLGTVHGMLWAILGLGTLAALLATPTGSSVSSVSSPHGQLPSIVLFSIGMGAIAVAAIVVYRATTLSQPPGPRWRSSVRRLPSPRGGFSRSTGPGFGGGAPGHPSHTTGRARPDRVRRRSRGR